MDVCLIAPTDCAVEVPGEGMIMDVFVGGGTDQGCTRAFLVTRSWPVQKSGGWIKSRERGGREGGIVSAQHKQA